MRLTFICLAIVCLSCAQAVWAADDQKFSDIGEFKLKSGDSIQDCRIGYRTFGKLNADRSNVVIWPTWFLGRSEDIAANIGQGKLLDPSKFFVVAIDSLGDGISSSPSNSAKQPRMNFPKFTIRDMVATEHAMLVKEFGFRHIHAVIGQSMGGFQAFQWMVDYPDFMDKVVAVMGTPQAQASDILWTSVESAAIRNDKDWKDGNYSTEPGLVAARYMHLFVMLTPNQINKNVVANDAQEAIRKSATFGGKWDANDWLYQIGAVQTMNLFASEPLAKVAARVRCQNHDHQWHPGLGGECVSGNRVRTSPWCASTFTHRALWTSGSRMRIRQGDAGDSSLPQLTLQHAG